MWIVFFFCGNLMSNTHTMTVRVQLLLLSDNNNDTQQTILRNTQHCVMCTQEVSGQIRSVVRCCWHLVAWLFGWFGWPAGWLAAWARAGIFDLHSNTTRQLIEITMKEIWSNFRWMDYCVLERFRREEFSIFWLFSTLKGTERETELPIGRQANYRARKSGGQI